MTGFEKADTALRTGRAALLIEARDAGADGRAKLARHTLPGVEIWAPLTAERLGRPDRHQHLEWRDQLPHRPVLEILPGHALLRLADVLHPVGEHVRPLRLGL